MGAEEPWARRPAVPGHAIAGSPWSDRRVEHSGRHLDLLATRAERQVAGLGPDEPLQDNVGPAGQRGMKGPTPTIERGPGGRIVVEPANHLECSAGKGDRCRL